MWHRPEFSGSYWDGSPATAGTAGVDFRGAASVMSADTPYSHHPASVYGCSFPGGAGAGPYVAGCDGSTAGSAPYYGMYNLPSLAAASPWSAGHTPSLGGYNAVRRPVIERRTLHLGHAFNGHVKTAEQRTVVQQYGDWYTGH